MPKKKNTTQWVDVSLHTALAGCSCGYRDIQTTRRAAWATLHQHVLRAHPGESQYVIDRLRRGAQ